MELKDFLLKKHLVMTSKLADSYIKQNKIEMLNSPEGRLASLVFLLVILEEAGVIKILDK